MIFKLIYLLQTSTICLAFLNYDSAVRESDVEGLVGEEVRLPCEVDKENCGVFHNIKWYKGNERVFIFSESPDVKRPEGSLLQRGQFHYSEDNSEDWLEIRPLTVKDEGKYKCELTYLTVKESCSVVQFVNLKTLARPNTFKLSLKDGSPITNGTKIGPYLEGNDLTLHCEAGGAKPVPSVLWKNGSNKMQGRFHSEIDGEGQFIGTNSIQMTIGRQDLGKKLFCHVNNAAMPSPVTLSVQLDVEVSPYEVKIQSQNKNAFVVGEIVELLCTARGAKPAATLTWKNGTTAIFEARTNENIHEEDSEVAHADGTFETRSILRFQVSKYENGQQFNCEGMNSVLERQGRTAMIDSISLNVQFAPTVHVHPENTTLNVTESFLIQCEYTANPMELSYVHWYLDGQQLDIGGNPEKYRNGNIDHPSLFVVNSSAEDMGEYTCRVGNLVGVSNVTSRAYVIVQYPPEVAVLIPWEGPVSAERHEYLTVTCDTIRAYPPVTKVRWYLNEIFIKELPDCDGGNSTLHSDSFYCDVKPTMLVFQNITKKFHGNYTCQGMNDAGWGPVSVPTPLVVYYPPGNATLTYTPDIVIKGEQVNLTCSTDDDGRPASGTYIWTRNSHKVRNVTSKHWIIDSASLETEANFTCLPYNREGNGSMDSVAIDVLGKPTFIERLPTYHGALINAKEVSLTCHVECSPICEIIWYKDNIPLDNDTHYDLRSMYQSSNPATGDLESVVSILSWKMDMWPERKLHREVDNATFRCVSTSNQAGPGVSSDTKFRVEYPPDVVNISTQHVEVVEGNTPKRISCLASSYPDPNYYWLHNNETVATGAVLDLSFKINKTHSGEYTCVAENKHGSVTALAFVDVLFKPECKISRQDSSSRDSSQIHLKCRAKANPEDVSFRWSVGNETLSKKVLSDKLESRLYLEGSTASLGTYSCYVTNIIGESIPCEIDVTGLVETLGDDNLLLYVAIALAIIIVITVLIILLVCCIRQRHRGKSDTDSTKNDKAPEQKNNANPNENNPSIPDSENPKFYENLPFHGIQAPPNKPLLTGIGSDMEYADVDYSTYTYGPIPYKSESVSAAEEQRAKKEADRKGVPMRPPRKK